MSSSFGHGMWRTLTIVALVLFMSAFVFGQTDLGSISGVVRDSTGAVVADANVKVTLTSTNAERTTTSNNTGDYRIQNLTPGTYTVVVTKSGFQTYKATLEVAVGGHTTMDASLTVGSGSTIVEVVAGAGTEVNTQTQEMSQLIDTQQMAQLPSLTRNPYDFVAVSGNVSNGDSTSNGEMAGQELAARGVGFAINGQRESGTEILLDGVENVSVFGVAVGQNVPIDGVQEYSIITNNFGAEYGRASGGVVNVTTKAGSNAWHGSAWEFNRLAAYTANTFDNVAKGLPKGQYTRNQFGFQVGGPIIKNKVFVSETTEFTRVRSNSSQTQEIFDPAFLSYLPANAQAYFSAFGANPFPSAGVAATVDDINTASPGFIGQTCLDDVNCTTIPGGTPVFDTVNFQAPFDAGGGSPQNTYTTVGRLDINLTDKTQMFFRGANERDVFTNGTSFFSAYPDYFVGGVNYNQSYLFSINHNFNANLLNNTKVSFTRYNSYNSYNQAVQSVPDLMFVTPSDPATQGIISMPGLFNLSEPGLGGLPFGGPQNTIQFEHDLSWTKGRHNMKFGGQFTYIQLNVAYGAYAQAVEQLGSRGSTSMADLLNTAQNPGGSQLTHFDSRVNPQGALPCPVDAWGELEGSTIAPGALHYGEAGTNTCPSSSVVQPPLPAAAYARSYRYKDWAIYGQDSFRLTPRLTLNYGLRWEHFGVQHNNNQSLDSNFYFGPGSNFEEQVRNGGVQLTQQSSTGQFWQNQWGTLGPRVGFAYDVFGDGKTSLRGGFGISYERNFGNVTFNASFNPPASAVVAASCPAENNQCPTLVTNNNAGPFGVSGPALNLPPLSLRMPNPNIRTAQTQFWSLALQREVARNTIVELSYNGAHGVHLYDLENIDNYGSGEQYLGDPVLTTDLSPTSNIGCGFENLDTGTPECLTFANPQYSSINMRGSMGVSAYNALNLKFQTQNLHNTGLSLVANWTWAHALDDISSTFSDSLQGGSGYIGSLGYTDPFNPKLDWGPADYDVRHRLVISPIWETPWYKSGHSVASEVLGGWTAVGVFTARTGVPFTAYDYTYDEIGYTVPRLTPATAPTFHVSSNPQPDGVNSYAALTLPDAAPLGSNNPLLGISDLGPFPAGMTGRNAFRGPNAWNLDTAVSKKFKVTERVGMEFRAEGFNIFNHHNFYVFTPGLVQGGITVDEFKGGLNSFATGGNHDERRFGQFSLRVSF
ncbi:MAG TPA: TonB-dependent receptor [Terriglobales bacterium]|nr:TonB-dependent receptor [Terriglobales bacterium]